MWRSFGCLFEKDADQIEPNLFKKRDDAINSPLCLSCLTSFLQTNDIATLSIVK